METFRVTQVVKSYLRYDVPAESWQEARAKVEQYCPEGEECRATPLPASTGMRLHRDGDYAYGPVCFVENADESVGYFALAAYAGPPNKIPGEDIDDDDDDDDDAGEFSRWWRAKYTIRSAGVLVLEGCSDVFARNLAEAADAFVHNPPAAAVGDVVELDGVWPIPDEDLCDECAFPYPVDARSTEGPWHANHCSLHVPAVVPGCIGNNTTSKAS